MSVKFWRPGTVAPGSALEREEEGNTINVQPFVNQFDGLELEEQRKRLPIYKYRRELLYLVENYRTTVIVGETGCGKTTQIPQYLHESGWTEGGRCVVCTQPRRLAAKIVAKRVAEEMKATLGSEVGYGVRFDNFFKPNFTRIKFVTDGVLIREMMLDPLLSGYSVIMVDEVHERGVYTDLLLGLVKQIMKQRSELRLLVASATLDAEEIAEFFNTSKSNEPPSSAILSVEGRMHPVDVFYLQSPVPDYVIGVVDAISKIHQSEPSGDILAFLTGQDEVDRVVDIIKEKATSGELTSKYLLKVFPLYSALPYELQANVFQPVRSHVRKVIVATNVAETSVTIPNIVYVVDCGFAKFKAYDPLNGVETLVVAPISRASAIQRAGRAGRVKAGKVFRLYTENSYRSELPARTPPAMQRTDLAQICLQLKALGVDNIARFDFLSPPTPDALIRSLDLLYSLGAIDDTCQLTSPLGEQMVELPIDPKLSKILIVSGEFGCSEEILIVSSMLQIENVFFSPPNSRKEALRKKMQFASQEGDHLSLINLFKAFEKYGSPNWCSRNFINRPAMLRASEIRKKLLKLLSRFKIPLVACKNNHVVILRNILTGYFPNAARLNADGTYETVRGKQTLHIHPSSVLFDEKPPLWIMFHEIVLTDRSYARDVSCIEYEWLPELAPHFYEYNKFIKVDNKDLKI